MKLINVKILIIKSYNKNQKILIIKKIEQGNDDISVAQPICLDMSINYCPGNSLSTHKARQIRKEPTI